MRPLHLAVLAALLFPAMPGAQTSDPAALATRVQAHYAGIKDFEGDFVQTYEGGVLRTQDDRARHGRDQAAGPDALRLHQAGEARNSCRTAIDDLHAPGRRQAGDRQSGARSRAEATSPALFLAGQSDLARDFTPTFTALPGAAPGLVTLKLVTEEDRRRIRVDSASVSTRQRCRSSSSSAVDRQGGRSSFSFTNLKENRGLADNRLRVPHSTRRGCRDQWCPSSIARSPAHPLAVARGPVARRAVVAARRSGLADASPATPRCPQNYDIAVAEYTKLLRENPDNRDARQGLDRAKLRASQDHFTGRAVWQPPANSKRRWSNSRSPSSSTRPTPTSRPSCRSRARSCAPRSPFAKTARRGSNRSSTRASRRRCLAPICRRTSSCPTRWSSATPAPATSTPRSASSRT